MVSTMEKLHCRSLILNVYIIIIESYSLALAEMYLAQWGYLQIAQHLGHQGLRIVGRERFEKIEKGGRKRVEGVRKKGGRRKG